MMFVWRALKVYNSKSFSCPYKILWYVRQSRPFEYIRIIFIYLDKFIYILGRYIAARVRSFFFQRVMYCRYWFAGRRCSSVLIKLHAILFPHFARERDAFLVYYYSIDGECSLLKGDFLFCMKNILQKMHILQKEC